MKLKSFLIAAVALSMAAVVYAQTSQSSQSTSQSKSGNGQSSSSASGSGSASGWSSSSGSKNGFARGNSGGSGGSGGSGSGSGFGFMGKPTHAILYTLDSSNNSGDSNDQKTFEQHTNYMSEQQRKGKVLLFGPWRDQPGSMAIVMTKSDEEANEIAKNDPAVKSGNLTFEVRAWNVMTLSASGTGKIKL